MAFRNLSHRERVFQTPEYRRMVKEWVANKSPVPLTVFQEAYGKAFFNRSGVSQKPELTETGRMAFMNLMMWTGRAPAGMTWDEWENKPDKGSP